VVEVDHGPVGGGGTGSVTVALGSPVVGATVIVVVVGVVVVGVVAAVGVVLVGVVLEAPAPAAPPAGWLDVLPVLDDAPPDGDALELVADPLLVSELFAAGAGVGAGAVS
jgi:hypothetical protein